ncbi:unnamed protein product [Mytilus coruscus]|uniref:Myb-like domain-containing protein n=1 Tax=Mytilus coruscus TaxID=42192 RepID=A0A6J8B1D8_MYTCO|nr:unnamed protein product [Mytilus coruscus]
MASKRERQPNWSISEITLLQELVEKDEFVIKSKQTNTITNNKKNEKWAEICSKINAMGLQKRTTEQVKYKWGNLQQNAKKIFNDVKKQRKLTGGGPAPKPPSAVEEKIIEMMKDRPNFSGISCGFESTMPPVFESTPNGSFVESELDNSQQPCFSARVGDGQTGSVSSMVPESSFTSIPSSSTDSTSSIALITLTEEFAVEEDTSSSSIAKKPDGKRKRVSLGDLQKMQYEVLEKQKSQADLLTTKLKMEINRKA